MNRHISRPSPYRTVRHGLRHPLDWFFAASVVLGSLATWVLAKLPPNPVLLPLVALPISYVPALTALLLGRSGDARERRAFRRRLTTWRAGARWYGVVLLGLPLIHLAGVALAGLWGGRFALHLERFVLLPLFLLTNLGEEIGWRGYALPRLQERMPSLAASLVLGLVWAAFHWVALLQNPELPWGYLIVGSVMLIAMSVVMTWVFNRTGQSIIVVTLLHAMYDVVSIGVVPLGETGVPLLAFALSAGLVCLLALLLVAVQGVELGT